ncbi:ribosome maturation factor RimP [Terasakiispira papahanaumokuakeensis]|uniref:Ribosome maturation factor RimP n=1 Tax=Terasakiispira papahanaumokuakeensis TaxID=197479 RepID=A0A1E2VD08_9GAMM|nr:ribosome maturation factor RimP [Terasakiispira papahanaumokuakeensis]ODC04861.1 ribosome maturation factor RimP [Terasakiispira papahanaumokuakeensis]
MASKESLLQQLIQPVVESLGFELWGIEFFSQGRHTQLRIYIDREAGVHVDDCAKVSHQVSAIMDVEDPISGEYTLEVSSPGMDRPLFSLAHYERLAGERIQLKLRVPFEGRRKYTGLLKGVEADEVILQVEDEEYCFPFDSIDQARVIPNFDGPDSFREAKA